MTIKQNKGEYKTWGFIALITIVLIGIAYLVLRPSKANTKPTSEISTNTIESSAAENLQAPLNLIDVLKNLAVKHHVEISLDNPFMEDCPFPKQLVAEELEIEALLKKICHTFHMELHKESEDVFLLIGGTCD